MAINDQIQTLQQHLLQRQFSPQALATRAALPQAQQQQGLLGRIPGQLFGLFNDPAQATALSMAAALLESGAPRPVGENTFGAAIGHALTRGQATQNLFAQQANRKAIADAQTQQAQAREQQVAINEQRARLEARPGSVITTDMANRVWGLNLPPGGLIRTDANGLPESDQAGLGVRSQVMTNQGLVSNFDDGTSGLWNPDTNTFDPVDPSTIQPATTTQITGGPSEFGPTETQAGKAIQEAQGAATNTLNAFSLGTELRDAVASGAFTGTPAAVVRMGSNLVTTAVQLMNAEAEAAGEDQLGQDKVDAIVSSDYDFSGLDERVTATHQHRSALVSLAFARALALNGSRVTEQDVQNAIKEIGGDIADPEKGLVVLDDLMKRMATQATNRFNVTLAGSQFKDTRKQLLNTVQSGLDTYLGVTPQVSEGAGEIQTPGGVVTWKRKGP